jgi:hypothetical protein
MVSIEEQTQKIEDARKRIEKAKTFEKLFNCDRPIIPP